MFCARFHVVGLQVKRVGVCCMLLLASLLIVDLRRREGFGKKWVGGLMLRADVGKVQGFQGSSRAIGGR